MDQISGLGIGSAVGLGALIGLGIVAPDVEVIEYVATVGFYGMLSGFLYELYRWAFTFKAPTNRGGRGGGHKAPGAR